MFLTKLCKRGTRVLPRPEIQQEVVKEINHQKIQVFTYNLINIWTDHCKQFANTVLRQVRNMLPQGQLPNELFKDLTYIPNTKVTWAPVGPWGISLTHLSPCAPECQPPSCHICAQSPSGPGLHVALVPGRCGWVFGWKYSHQWRWHGPALSSLRTEAPPEPSKPPSHSQAPSEATGSAWHCFGPGEHPYRDLGRGPCILPLVLAGHRARRRK